MVPGEALEGAAPAATGSRPSARRRAEFGMLSLAFVLVVGLYVLAGLGADGSVPNRTPEFALACLALLAAAHLVVRRLAPNASSVLLPLAALLNGMGYVFISHLDAAEASNQLLWTVVGLGCFAAVLALFPRAIDFERYRYSIALVGIVLLLLPLAPHIGEDINGARLWVRAGPLSFQPEEFAKIAMALFFASVLAERADLLATGTRRIGRWLVLDPRYLAPLVGAWGLALLILLAENDLGSSFLFFTLLVSLLWVATGRPAYLGLGAGLFGGAAVFALEVVHHAATRVQAWLHPWAHFSTSGYQIIEGWFALAAGGMWGLGPGRGNPQVIPEASTDFIFASIGEQVGLAGLTAILASYLLMMGSGLHAAVRARTTFAKLLATGLSLLLAVQVFVVAGGITRIIPVTGITLPFISYGGSSLVSNYVLLAVLLRISNDNADVAAYAGATPAPASALATKDTRTEASVAVTVGSDL
jgi:cell division protein FtsW (lipid II flippase)